MTAHAPYPYHAGMFLLIQLFCAFPLIACSIVAGCCRESFDVRLWTAAAMLMPTIGGGGLALLWLSMGEVAAAGWVLLAWCGCYAISRLLRLVTCHVKRVLTEPYQGEE